MLIGQRAASTPVQIVALILGVVEGLLLYATVIRVSIFVLPEVFDLPLRFLTIAFCAYFLAAPTTWSGLARRALLIVAVSLLGYAAIGYLLAFLFLRGTPMPGTMPSQALAVQAMIAALGVAAAVGFIVLRDRGEQDFLASATVPAPDSAVPTSPSDTRS